MKLAWKITAQDVARVRAVVAAHRKSNFVRERFLRNVRGEHPVPTGARFWKAHLMGLLTTQQRSGPTSAVTRFLGGKPFRLTYGACRRARRPEARIAAELRAHGGIRRVDTVAAQAARNLEYPRGGGWEEIRPLLLKLHGRHRPPLERAVAETLAERIAGFGPKQSRNVLQALGLTRHEIPLDSRLTSWLNETLELNAPLVAGALTDAGYYAFVSDAIQEVCKRAGVYPCILDAAVFASFDPEPWKAKTPF